ncbi:MAG: DUF4919 domain-containing protein [Bacteroides sp.]|nr:DUF4919 domain-containing protein [Bacteroides sp.]MCM1413580.1 DUF4919 domain-containing protein [Bacteroides sp.]MCM1471203.1 DUF4919 domain-containing protein [Bacteroides sp.]
MTIRTSLLVITLSIVSLIAGAQTNFDRIKREKPNMAEISRLINDRSSDYYYPRLMKEFEANDTLMKLDKYRMLYLGYALQEDYNPYRSSNSSIEEAVKVNRERLTPAECDTIIDIANKALADNPFNLQQMSYLIEALRQKRQDNLANIWQYKFNYILMAIVSTGTGVDEDNAWYVIEPQHEYILLNAMGYTVTNHLFDEPYYEFLTVADQAGDPAGGYYFNIHNMLEEYYRKYPEEL